MSEIKHKIEKTRQLIRDTKKEREKRILLSNIITLLVDKEKYTCKKDFIDYLEKEKIDKTLLKLVKKTTLKSTDDPFGSKCYVWENFSKDKWAIFSKLLVIAETYATPYELYKQQHELCYYTDCYKKLTTEKTCLDCLSINPVEGIYCNQCGEKF